jgi:membrane-associated phospholipid phosphatase
MKEISNRIVYFFLFAILWLSLAAFTFSFPKAESFIAMQIPHSSVMNLIMQTFSDIADGLFIISLFIFILLFVKIRLSFILLIGFAITGITSQTLKNTFYKGEARPIKWYENEKIHLQIPDGLKPHSWNSFPSGHSATAAFLFTFLAFRTRKPYLLLLCALFPFLSGYSRIYLFHHFPVDVLAGLAIGISMQLVIESSSGRWFMNPKFDKTLLRK